MTEHIDWDDDLAVARYARHLDAEDRARRERLEAPDALAAAARWYAAQGIAVFPLQPGTKVPATRHGLKDATTDPGQVDAWWTDMPDANVGLPTGYRFDVIDVDPPDGWASLAVMRADGLVPPALGYATTPRGGVHIYVPATASAGNRAGILPGIDIRACGGYVVGPPSAAENGGYWTWAEPLNLDAVEHDLPACPRCGADTPGDGRHHETGITVCCLDCGVVTTWPT